MMPLIVVLALSLAVGFYGPAFAAKSGAEDPRCNAADFPDPTSGPFLTGTFTAAVDKSTCSLDYPGAIPEGYTHYNFHVKLWKRWKSYMFSGPLEVPEGSVEGNIFVFSKKLCEYTNAEIKAIINEEPCNWYVGDPFGFPLEQYVPIVVYVRVTDRDFCAEPGDKQMIKGFIKIRLVPWTPPGP